MTSITVQNAYKWMLDPRYGRISIYVDGRKAGIADLGRTLAVEVAPGEPHSVRVALVVVPKSGAAG